MDLGDYYPCLNVENLDRSLAFYETLGFEVVGDHRAENWAMVQHNNMALCLFQGHIDENLINFRGGDVEAIHKEGVARGLVFDKPPVVESDGSWAAEIRDPDGNSIYFNTFPAERAAYVRDGRLITRAGNSEANDRIGDDGAGNDGPDSKGAASGGAADVADENPAPHMQSGARYWSVSYIRAPRQLVFDHITQGEHTKRYYFDMPISDPGAVGEALWYGPDEGSAPIRGEVLALDRPSRFSHTFAFTHRDEPATVVDYELEALGDRLTKLTLHHHGFESRTATFVDVSEGWPAILASLKTLVETGAPLEWPD